MRYLVELPVGGADGTPHLVGVEIEQAEGALVEVARPGQIAARAARSLGEMLAGIRPVAESFVDGFAGMAHAPDEIGLEFGLSLSAQADLIISSAATQANFTVSLTWRGTAPSETPVPSEISVPSEPVEAGAEHSRESAS